MKRAFQNINDYGSAGIKLDMSRGKPSPEQLDLSQPLLAGLTAGPITEDGTDCRNYGALLGLAEAREFFAGTLGVAPTQVIAGGNSSLALMHDALVFLSLYGCTGGIPWSQQRPIRFLCPVPGYDRHFSICEHLGIEMLNIAMKEDGPDISQVERLVKADSTIKGIWCMPKYSNPTGTVYSTEIAERLARMPAAADDFRIFWDDAYRWHHLTEEKIPSPDIIKLCELAGHPDRPLMFASTSKVTFASAGVALMAASRENIAWWQSHFSIQTIGPDKLNQLRHLRFFKEIITLSEHMERHRALLRPRFDAVHAVFRTALASIDGVSWSVPKGGYFIDLITPPGFASATVALAQTAGLTLTPAGASFPYRRDPLDKHIRIAPTFPSLQDIELAAQGITLALKEALRRRSTS